MANPMRNPFVRWLKDTGWHVERTKGGHLRATHPDASAPMFLAATPSDHRAERNGKALARRLLGQIKEH